MKLTCVTLAFIVVAFTSRPSFAADAAASTHHPIVLAHGMGGFDRLFGVVDYFYGIAHAMRRAGAEVYVTHVSAFNDTALRGEQLLEQVEYILAATGAEKVHLIGHSHGGLDVRWVAAARPDVIASVTAVATPHAGAAIADYLREHIVEGSFTEEVFAFFADSFGAVLALLSGTDDPQDAIAGVESLTSAALSEFNRAFPAGVPETPCGEGAELVDGIHYFSWSGASTLTNLLDISDGYMALASAFSREDSDGLVGKCSSHLGRVLRDDYRMNHGDEVNQVLGLVSWFETDPKAVFKAHATRLRNLGL